MAIKKPSLHEKTAPIGTVSVSKKVCLQQIIQPDTLIDCQKDELDFVFCEREPYKGTAPEQKTKSAKTAQLCGFSAFKVLYFFRVQDAFLLEKNSSLFSKFFYARSNRLFRQSHGSRRSRFNGYLIIL